MNRADDDWITVLDASRRFHISRNGIYLMIEAGKLTTRPLPRDDSRSYGGRCKLLVSTADLQNRAQQRASKIPRVRFVQQGRSYQ
jgi:hypothetical protein